MQEIGKLRKLLRTLENFLEAVQRKNHTLFPTSSSVQQVSLGPVIALDGLDQTMKDVARLADTVVSEWVNDMGDLQKLTDGYLVPVTLAAKTDLLQPPQAELLKLLCEEGKVKKLTNGASLMGGWRGWLRSLSRDGCGGVAPVETFKSWADSIRNLSECAEMSHAARTITIDLLGIANIAARKRKAKEFMTANTFDLGRDLSHRLAELAREDGPEPEIADEGPEPAPKKAKTS